ncbi:MAG TPA: hypothetical protein VFU05_00050 [Cyclobacteriaceae bacterium]|nr:hypothetical protein [Cyclobacteriaceae bacterium]
MNYPFIVLVVCSLFLYSCTSTGVLPKYELGSDYYTFSQRNAKPQKVFVEVDTDSIKIVPVDKSPLQIDPTKDKLFTRPSFDADIMVTLFKYRTATGNLPRQLTTDFSGNLFLGYRLDRFRVHSIKTPTGRVKKIQHKAICIGGFGGLGSTQVTPWTTNQGTTDEYNGLVLSRGLALMFGIGKITVGLGLGRDYLTDRDKDIWIYQNKTWYGMTFSINLN